MLETRHSEIDFIGKDGFHWFIGQVVPDEAWRDKNNQNFDQGFRAKVRILGHHPGDSEGEGGIDDKDLPWAHFLISPQFGAGHSYGGTGFALQGGEVVFGFFVDGEEAQQPVVIGCFSSTSDTIVKRSYEDVLSKGTSGFFPYAPPKALEKANYVRRKEDKPNDPTGGVVTSDNTVKDDTEGNKVEEGTVDKHFDNKTRSVKKSQKCIEPAGLLGDASKILEDFTKRVGELEEIKDGWIDPITSTVVDMDKLVDKAADKASAAMAAITRRARSGLFDEINKTVDGAVNFLDPNHLIKNLEIKKQKDQIFCLFENILNGLKNTIAKFLKGMLGKIVNLPLCALENLLGGILSDLTNSIQNAIKGPLSAISKLAGITLPNFSDVLNKQLLLAQAGLALFSCEGSVCEPEPSDFETNTGAVKKLIPGAGKIGGIANKLASISGGLTKPEVGALLGSVFPGIDSITSGIGGFARNVTGIVPGLSENTGGGLGTVGELAGGCSGTKGPFGQECGPPKVEIFGGNGIGGFADAVINEIGQVVGVRMKDLGFGYTEAPYIKVKDNCNNGNGATLEPILFDGKIVNMVVVDPGGGYLGAESATADDIGTEMVGIIDAVQVVQTGNGYQEGDTITSDTGCAFLPSIENGRITGVEGVCKIPFTKFPELTVNSKTGSGAVVRPITKFVRKEEFVGVLPPDAKLITVISCPRFYS